MCKKQEQLEAVQKRQYEQKETLTNKIIIEGLWQSEQEVDIKLATYKSASAKLAALKNQLQFRRNVLCQPGDKALFQLSSVKSGKFTVDTLCHNLKCLITSALSSKDTNSQSFLVGKRVRHPFSAEDEELNWYNGHVISQVPGFEEWYNIVYDNDEAVYTFQLNQDLESGDLELAA